MDEENEEEGEDGEEIEAEGDDYDQEVYGEEEQRDGEEDDEYGDDAPNYSYQDPVQEVSNEDEQTSDEEESKGQVLNYKIPDNPYHNIEDDQAHFVDNASPMTDHLAHSGHFRASDPGRFDGIDDLNDIQLIARRESNLN